MSSRIAFSAFTKWRETTRENVAAEVKVRRAILRLMDRSLSTCFLEWQRKVAELRAHVEREEREAAERELDAAAAGLTSIPNTPYSYDANAAGLTASPAAVTGDLASQVLKLLVPEKETGNVIGRGGERLKEIRTATGSQTYRHFLDTS